MTYPESTANLPRACPKDDPNAMLPPSDYASATERPEDTGDGFINGIRTMTWTTLPEMPQFTASTILCVGRRFFLYLPDLILKLGIEDEGEARMTHLAYNLLGSIVPCVDAIVVVEEPIRQEGILIARQPGIPIVELWPNFTAAQQETVKSGLIKLLVRMRENSEGFDNLGRPGEQPYVTVSFHGQHKHTSCLNRSAWDASRIRALKAAASEADLSEDRMLRLEQVQNETCNGGAPLVDRPVLTHGDLSDRNILVDPETLELTGLIDWEQANIAPAYFEYVDVCLSGGHEPAWRQVMFEVLREVLRLECERQVAKSEPSNNKQLPEKDSGQLFRETLSAWNALVNVERPAQGYSDDCYWTFENESQPPSVRQ